MSGYSNSSYSIGGQAARHAGLAEGTSAKRDIVVTWPKTKPLADYLRELERAEARGLEINYRVARRPWWEFGALREQPVKCFMVHDGAVRGYNQILYAIHREIAEVRDVEGGFWPPGDYIVRHPHWFPIQPIPMRGFQGWRWFLEPYVLA